MGYEEEELVGKHTLILSIPDEREAVNRFFGRQFVKLTNPYLEYPYNQSGQKVWLGQNTLLILKDGRRRAFRPWPGSDEKKKWRGELPPP
jgi:PAS domain S-box-containing protein